MFGASSSASIRYRDMLSASDAPRTTTVTRRVAGEVERGLAGGVAAADDVDVLARESLRLGRRGAVVDAGALQLGETRCLEPAVLDAEREHDRPGGDGDAVGGVDGEAAVEQLELDDALRQPEARPEQPRLLVGALRELAARESAREAEVVPDQRARAGLSADRAGVDDGGAQTLR